MPEPSRHGHRWYHLRNQKFRKRQRTSSLAGCAAVVKALSFHVHFLERSACVQGCTDLHTLDDRKSDTVRRGEGRCLTSLVLGVA